MNSTHRLIVAVAGATGFIGQALCRVLSTDHHVIGLTRRGGPGPDIPGVEWRRCDLFSSLECELALEDVDVAIYLVHSMIPSARLTQGTFQDMDLILADNFARAALRNGLQRIIYLGGIVPRLPPEQLSRHLSSRLEVEQTLGARGIPLTSLRASIVIGAHGSSFSIFRTLLTRLPVVPCPTLGYSLTQPVALADVLRLIKYCLVHPKETEGHFDIGSREILSYRELLELTVRVMNLKRLFFHLPVRSRMFCRVCLRLLTGAPMALISPLVGSMRFDMVAADRRLQEQALIPGLPLGEAISIALKEEGYTKTCGSAAHSEEPEHYDVRSVQRLPLPRGLSARAVVDRYLHWMPWVFRWFMCCEEAADRSIRVALVLPGFRRVLIELSYCRNRSPGDDRQVYFITGGALVRKVDRSSRRPRLEFREVLDKTAILIAIHNYHPTLPPWIYRHSQALAHLWGTRSFARHLRKPSKGRRIV